MNTLPLELTEHVLSFADPRTLVTASEVCKKWKQCPVDELWKSHLLHFVEGAQKDEKDTWKSTYRVFHNWVNSKGSLTIFDKKFRSAGTTLLEDGSLIDVSFYRDGTKMSTYNHKTLEVKEIKISEIGRPFDYKIAFHGNKIFFTEVPFRENNAVYCFDLLTGQLIREIKLEKSQGFVFLENAYINDSEIMFFSINQIISIYSLTDPTKDVKYDFKTGVSKVGKTSNFIIYSNVNDKNEEQIIAVNREGLISRNLGKGTFYVSGPYLIIDKGESVKIYHEEIIKGQATLTPKFSLDVKLKPHDQMNGESTVRCYKNWLCFLGNQRLTVWDLKSGKQLVDFCNEKLGYSHFNRSLSINQKGLAIEIETDSRETSINFSRYIVQIDFTRPLQYLNRMQIQQNRSKEEMKEQKSGGVMQVAFSFFGGFFK